MDILLAVLITLMVVALLGAGISLVRLNKESIKWNDIDVMRNELEKASEEMHRDTIDRINGWVASTDRRFDHVRTELEKQVELTKKLRK